MVFAAYVLASIILLGALLRLLVANTVGLPGDAQAAMNELFGQLAVLFIVVAIGSLLVVAAIMHFLTDGTNGSFASTLPVAAWSYAPEVLFMPIDYWLARRHLDGRTIDGSDPQRFAAELEAIEATTGIADMVLPFVIVAWSVYILAMGVAAKNDASLDDTIFPAVLVGIGSLILVFLF